MKESEKSHYCGIAMPFCYNALLNVGSAELQTHIFINAQKHIFKLLLNKISVHIETGIKFYHFSKNGEKQNNPDTLL